MQFFITLNRYAKDMSPNELRRYFPEDVSDAFLMRTLIMNEKQFGEIYPRTLRGVWYSVVKPTLDKLDKLTAEDMDDEKLVKWDSVLSRYMGDLLRRGYIKYKDLGIEDQSRRKEVPSEHYSTFNQYQYQVTGKVYPNIIIATEKDTIYSILLETATLFGCSCLSSKGQNSLGAMEYLITEMDLPKSAPTEWFDCDQYTNINQYEFYKDYHKKQKTVKKLYDSFSKQFNMSKENMQLLTDSTSQQEISGMLSMLDDEDTIERISDYILDVNLNRNIYNQIEWRKEGKHLYVRQKTEYRFDTIYILTMTDYDPSGYYIASALKTQAEDILKALGYTSIKVVIDRIGIEPHQLSDYEVQQNKYTPKKNNLDKWFDITGGINGEKKGLELDAFHPDKIKEIFVEKLLQYVDISKYEEFVREAYLRKMVLKTLSNKINLVTNDILSEYKEQIPLDENYSIVDASDEGYNYLPLENMVGKFDSKNITKSIHEVAQKHFK